MRPLTEQLIRCATLDEMPDTACKVDFGIEPPNEVEKFGALQYAIRRGLVTEEELDAALGDGKALTEIVNRGDNPYACEIKTAWDDMVPAEDE